MNSEMEEYKRAASMMPGSVIIFQLAPDETMRVFFYSKKAQDLTGMEQIEVDQTVSSDGFNMIIEDDQKVIIRKIKISIANHEELDVTYRQHHKMYGVIWVHMKASIVGEIDGQPVFLATMLDVTHEMLNSSAIMEASDRSICVIEKYTKLLLYGNTKFYELIHREPSESMGIYCYDALCGNSAFRDNDQCLCFSTINIEKPFEYYNPDSKQYLSMYGREIMWGEHEAYVFYLTDQTEEKFKEKQLKNAQQRFEMTLDNSDLFIWEYDMVNNQCINPKKAVMRYGLPPVIDNYPESLYDMGHTPPETVEQIKDVKRRLLNGESDFTVERRILDKDGNSQWMKVSYSLEKDGNGRPVRALVCGTDITEQKQKEFKYEEEIRLKKTVTTDTKILAILNLTQNKIVENDAKTEVLRSYLALGTVNEVMNAVCEGFIAMSDQENYRKRFNREQMLSNYERGIMHDTYCHQFQQLSGWYESAYDLILNPSTGDVEAITSMKNVTDEVRSKQVVNKLTAIDYDMIMTIDVATGDAYQYDRESDTETNYGRKLTREEYEHYEENHVWKSCTEAEVKQYRLHTSRDYVLKKLETLPVYMYMYSMSIDGHIIRKRNIYTYLDPSHKTILCASQDVTEYYIQEEKQKKELSVALEKAEIANKAKTSFLSRVSHDMRTPLNGILGLTMLMKEKMIDASAQRDLMQMELSGKYLLDLINDVLDVSSIEAGKLELHPSPCDGQLVLANISKLIQPSVEGKNITLTVESEGVPSTLVYIDEARVQQITMNILGNAVKFTPEGGKVKFLSKVLSATDTYLVNEFIIEDNGMGMDEAFIPHLFEPFSQENATMTNSKNGTGLGMSITKRIVELMNGTIQVESRKEVGTRVTVVLQFPFATEEQIRAGREAVVPQCEAYQLEGKRVLVCEDHPLNMEIARRILEKVGILVEHAEDGRIGVTMFQNAPLHYYDAILMDIRMPVMDGLEATRMIRGLPREDAGRIPILAMTANALNEDVKNAAAAGMNAHLSKPIDPALLYGTLTRFMNRTED